MRSSGLSAWSPVGETISFGARLSTAFETYGQLCVGIDPHPYLLNSWGLGDSAASLREFGLRVVDAAAGRAGIIKPQVAFFERFGSAGYAALEDVLAAARATDLIVIADVKRGDVGTSVEAYADAWLTPGSALEVDAMTISAFQGVGSIEAPMRLADSNGKGLFVLAATSNPEAFAVQTATISHGDDIGLSVASTIVKSVGKWNATQGPRVMKRESGFDENDTVRARRPQLASIGVVLGATVDFAAFGIDLATDTVAGAGVQGVDRVDYVLMTPILGPGFGHQGAQFSDLASLYGAAAPSVIVSASRSILQAGPVAIEDAVSRQAAEVMACRG